MDAHRATCGMLGSAASKLSVGDGISRTYVGTYVKSLSVYHSRHQTFHMLLIQAHYTSLARFTILTVVPTNCYNFRSAVTAT